MHFYVITICSPRTRGNVGGGMVSVSTALWYLTEFKCWNGFDWGYSMWKSRTRKRKKHSHTHYRKKPPLCSLHAAEWKPLTYEGEEKKWEWECAREIFCCSKPLSTVEKCDWLHIHSAGALPQWSTSVCSLNSAELIRIYLTSVGRHLHSLQNGTNNSRAQAAVHTAGIFKRGKKRCRYSTQGMVR